MFKKILIFFSLFFIYSVGNADYEKTFNPIYSNVGTEIPTYPWENPNPTDPLYYNAGDPMDIYFCSSHNWTLISSIPTMVWTSTTRYYYHSGLANWIEWGAWTEYYTSITCIVPWDDPSLNKLVTLTNNTASSGMDTATEISNGNFWAIAKFWVGFIIFMTLIIAVISIVKFRKG